MSPNSNNGADFGDFYVRGQHRAERYTASLAKIFDRIFVLFTFEWLVLLMRCERMRGTPGALAPRNGVGPAVAYCQQ